MQQLILGVVLCHRMRYPANLEQAVRLAHGRLQVQALDVLPVLLEQGDQEVDRHLHDTT